MIVRILSEGQFRIESAHLDELNSLDNQVVKAVAEGNEAGFRTSLTKMIALVRHWGTAVPMEELIASDVVLPTEDISLEEARSMFAGEGVIPG